jgi:hypothetical protein
MSDLGIYTDRATTGAGCTALSNVVTIIAESASIVWVFPNLSLDQFQIRVYNQPRMQVSVVENNALIQLV